MKKLTGLALGLALITGVGVGVSSTQKKNVETKAATGSFNLVTDASKLSAGDILLFVYSSSTTNKAAGLLGTQKYMEAVDASISNGVLTSTDAAEYTLGGSLGAWTFTSTEGTIGATAAKALSANAESRVTTWTISISNTGIATITSTTTSYGTIKYNSGSPRFLNYASGQSGISLYKKGSAATEWSLTYSGNGNTSGTAPVDSKKYSATDKTTTLKEPGDLAKTGYTFGGWNTKSDGSGNNYDVGAEFEVAQATTIYAKWLANKYTVTYNGNGNSSGEVPVSQTADYNTSIDLASNTGNLVRTGYKFAGWNTQSDGKGTSYEIGASYKVTGNVTLYAKWAEKKPGIDYVLVTDVDDLDDGDTVIIVSSEYNYAMSTTQNSNNRGRAEIEKDDDTITVNDTSVEIFTLEAIADTNYFAFNCSTGYIYAASSSSNYLRTQETLDDNGKWEIKISEDGTASVIAKGNYTRNALAYNNGSSIFSCYSSATSPVSLYKADITPRTLESIVSVSADIEATNNTSSWSVTNAEVMGKYTDSSVSEDITSKCELTVLTEYPTVTSSGTMTVDLKATFKNDTAINKTVSVDAVLTFIDPYSIQNIYNKKANDSIEFDGVYMGDTNSGMVIMNGEYGMLAYYKSATKPTGYVAGETKVTVSGTLSIYKNLYETNDGPTMSVLTDATRLSHIQTPQTYIVTGDETSDDVDLASRKTNVTGYIKSYVDVSGNKNATINVNGKDVTLFVSKDYWNNDVETIFNDSVANKTEIVIEGFTGFYTNFQVLFTNIVQTGDYTADQFGQDFMTLTNFCDDTNNHESQLLTVWLTLNSSSYYLKLDATEKAKVVAATASKSGSTLEQAMDRYDHCIARYSKLNDFIGRDTSGASRNISVINSNSDTTIAIVAVISLIGVSAVGGYFFIRKTKHE